MKKRNKENKIIKITFILILILLYSCKEELQLEEIKIDSASILTQLKLDSKGKTEVVKNFPNGFPETLIKRGTPMVYTKENSNNFEYIGMPIGGIAAGQLYLGGDGQLWFWDIFSLNHNMGQLKGEEAYEFPYERSKPNEKGARMIDQGFSVTTTIDGVKTKRNLNRDGFDDIEFLGQYPIGEVTYREKELPIEVKMEAFSPFTPLDLDNSILPATIFNFKIKNTSAKLIEVQLDGWMENAVLISSRENIKNAKGTLLNSINNLDKNTTRLECSIMNENEWTKNQLDYGSMSLSVMGNEGEIRVSSAKEEVSLTSGKKLVGTIGKQFVLKPGEDKEVSYVLTWYFPKTYAAQNKWGNTVPEDTEHAGGDTTRYYSKLFKNANNVSDYIIENYSELSKNTYAWRDTWYDSTLPYWFLDRTFLNTSILASSTVSLIGDKLYYGTEGGNQGPGTCTHVYGYTQAPGRLFPELEKSIREQVDFKSINEGGALKDDGTVRFRWFNMGMAVDGQAGIIMKSYQIHQMSADNSFLKKNYENIKKVMNGLIDNNDVDHDGILTGAQHNTLDADWYGKVTWLSLYYTAALRATAIMADEMDDVEYSEFCEKIANKGKKYIEENLFNGEYFIHEPDPLHPESPGTYTGLEYSQLLGQSWAYQVGLGEILDPKKVKTALESMWKYNFTTDVGVFRKAHPTGRWYAMPGEGGIIACTWPQGGSEVLEKGDPRFAAYNNECQNGYEYAASSLMMWHDMPYNSLAHIWYMQNTRYHGAKRNPWCEIEWGIHYARSMASYGHFVAVSGFDYHGPKKRIEFSPKIQQNNFKSAFVTAEGWGSYSQKIFKTHCNYELELAYGKLSLKKITLPIYNNNNKIKKIQVLLNGEIVSNSFKQFQNKLVIDLEEIIVDTNKKLTISYKK